MTAVRRRVSDRLMALGATLALDSRDIWRKARQNGTAATGGDLSALFAIDLLSTTAIRLGRLIMPATPPPAPDRPHP
ncbi:MAG TPA: hypothetical protein VGJ95_23600 [Pseudonocardiaceae bacterium]|jgi:hypothetical protein